MVLVILQHSYLNINMKLIPLLMGALLWNITSLAAVAFVSISGATFSYHLFMQPDWRIVYRRYITRALFLLFAAHLAINMISYPFRMVYNNFPDSVSFLTSLLLNFPITDTIASCLLVSPIFIIRFGSVSRALIIASLLIASRIAVAFVNPVTPSFIVMKEALFGTVGEPKIFWFPLVPWLAIFLSGSYLGQALSRIKQGAVNVPAFMRQMKKAGIMLAACSLILIVGYRLLRMKYANNWDPELFGALLPNQLAMLLPGLLAVLIWICIAVLHRINISGQYPRFLWFLSIFGRTSLFTYVVQFAIVESAPAILGFTGSLRLAGFLVLFMTGLGVMFFLSFSYGRMRGWLQENDYHVCLNSVSAGRSL
jgi:hypothetical protein